MCLENQNDHIRDPQCFLICSLKQSNKFLLAGSSDEGNSSLVESFGGSACSSTQNQNLTQVDFSKPDEVNMEQLVRARKMGLLEFSPQDELEGELVYFQHRLLQNAVAKKRHIGISSFFPKFSSHLFFKINLKLVILFVLYPAFITQSNH